MRTTAEFLLAPLLFAALATFVSRPLGRRGLVVLAAGWMAVLSAYILASVPSPAVPLHDFERSPVPALLATLAGTVAATAFASARQWKRSAPASVLSTSAVYLVIALPVGLAVSLWQMG